ncbi:MAG: peptidylprolyl isomerase, partial [Candidatus Obscuribacterales bacterium]|nr:peptidylprolyl isomerase [Candidatus Obscuribacterales bacterium]
DLPADVAICSVDGSEIKVGDYRRMLRIQQIQNNQNIVRDPSTKARLLEQAKQLNIALSPEEKTKLLEAAHQQKGEDPKQFQAFLKESKTTEQQFDEEVIRTGLAFKTSNALIEQTLLSDLVNREIMAQAAKKEGAEKKAMNQYLSFKHSRNYDAMLKQTGLSPDELRDELVKAELAKVELEKIQASAKVSDAELKKLYEVNKSKLKHGERIKLSTILIACPENDIGNLVMSVKHQLLKENPKLTPKELEAMSAQVFDQSKQKALILLGQAKGGADFAKLANENSNDPETQAKKTGGNMGWAEKKDIIPALGDEVFKLKAGEVLSQVVKSELGFNVYKVTAKEGPGDLKFDEVKPQLQNIAAQAKLQQGLSSWLEKQRKVTKIEFTPKFISIANQTKAAAGKSTQ